MSAPLDPRDPFSTGRGSQEISAAAERARKKLREDFDRLRAEIEEQGAEESPGGDPAGVSGFRSKAGAALAVFALTAAVAAAAAHFALNGGRASRESSVSVPSPPSGTEAGATTAGRGRPLFSSPLLTAVAPGLQIEALGPNGGLPFSAASPITGPAPLFVVGGLLPVGRQGLPGGEVAGASPVGRSPRTTPLLPEPHAPQQLAYEPPPPPPAPEAGNGDGGRPGENPGGGESPGGGPGDGGGPGHGGGDSGGSDDGVAAAGAKVSAKAISRRAEKVTTAAAPARVTKRIRTAAKSRRCLLAAAAPPGNPAKVAAVLGVTISAAAPPRNTERATLGIPAKATKSIRAEARPRKPLLLPRKRRPTRVP